METSLYTLKRVMGDNRVIILKIIENIPQYPEEINKKVLCKNVGIPYCRLNSYLCTATYMAIIGETDTTLTRYEKYYSCKGECS